MPPISKYGLCPRCAERFEATGRTYPEIDDAVREALTEHLFREHDVLPD